MVAAPRAHVAEQDEELTRRHAEVKPQRSRRERAVMA
jgi:hypothetical protein